MRITYSWEIRAPKKHFLSLFLSAPLLDQAWLRAEMNHGAASEGEKRGVEQKAAQKI